MTEKRVKGWARVRDVMAGWLGKTGDVDGEVFAQLAVPGIPRRKLQVELKDELVTVENRGHLRGAEHGEQVVFDERAAPPAKSAFRVPSHLDASRVQARLAEGMLSLSAPPLVPSRRIEVQSLN